LGLHREQWHAVLHEREAKAWNGWGSVIVVVRLSAATKGHLVDVLTIATTAITPASTIVS
jgi:hypothetical protein